MESKKSINLSTGQDLCWLTRDYVRNNGSGPFLLYDSVDTNVLLEIVRNLPQANLPKGRATKRKLGAIITNHVKKSCPEECYNHL